mgnify:CR=1 FL=1
MPTRHSTWLYLPSLIACSALPVSSTTSAADSPVRPNIVYILCDDLGYGDVKCLNPDGKIATPNMDRLAAAGMTFTDAHSGSSVCSPTRYGVLTGRYSWRSRLKQGVLEQAGHHHGHGQGHGQEHPQGNAHRHGRQ